MTASEFAFLALGLVLGVASGAALIEILRARPPVAREVRVTVAPNAIHARRGSTLADPAGRGEAGGPAAGGPGDRRWRDEIVATGEPAATGRRVAVRAIERDAAGGGAASGTPVRPGPVRRGSIPASAATAAPAPPASPSPVRADDDRPAPLWLTPSPKHQAGALVAVPMSMEPDPITTALRATAAASAVAAMRRSAPAADPSAAPPSTPKAPAKGSASSSSGGDGMVATGTAGATASRAGSGDTTPASAAPAPTGDQPPATTSATIADGPCAEERRVAEERCAVAARAREGADAAAENLRRTQRSYDEVVQRSEAAAATADPRAVRLAKEQAQQRFRDARNRAGTRDDVEAGARAWLAEINQINHDTREATLTVERDRAAAVTLAMTVERLAVEADAARINAERAEEACVAAREAVAACDEARALEAAAAARSEAMPAEPADEGPAAADRAAAAARSPRIAAATPEPEEEFAFSTPMNSQAGQDAPIVRILRGDREAMQHAVARLAGDDADARRRWQVQLGGLVEALVARSIEATAFDFPTDHPFWGPFTQSQSRDIAAALSSLGFRFDGFGGWTDDRVPSQRDLSMAVGYAGLDPMRVRRWPNEAETGDLLRGVRVAADEYVAGAAGGLTLGELLTLLGRRADGLAELWNQWGAVRPILLEAN